MLRVSDLKTNLAGKICRSDDFPSGSRAAGVIHNTVSSIFIEHLLIFLSQFLESVQIYLARS